MGSDGAAPRIEAIFEDLLAAVRADGRFAILALGWATVELDRAAAELESAFPGGGPYVAAADDEWLGARSRCGQGSVDGHQLVLLEPSTEGRLAAHLARHGEGPVVAWVALGTEVRTEARWRMGPFGPERPLDDPHGRAVLLLVDARRDTIRR